MGYYSWLYVIAVAMIILVVFLVGDLLVSWWIGKRERNGDYALFKLREQLKKENK